MVSLYLSLFALFLSLLLQYFKLYLKAFKEKDVFKDLTSLFHNDGSIYVKALKT